MTEGLAAQICSIVRQQLADAHRMLGAMLARLDATDKVDLGGRAATPEPIAAPSPKPSTVERRARLVRAKQRQATATAATGAAAPVTAAPADHWPVLRTEFHAAIKARHLSRGKVAADLGVSKGSIVGWLSPKGGPPSAANIAAIREWLSSTPEPEAPGATGEWPGLREQLRAVIRDRGLTHSQVGAALGVQGATIGGWLAQSHDNRAPGPHALGRVRVWLREGAPVPPAAAAGVPLFTLSSEEQTHLAGHLSLGGNARELRDRFGANRELLEQAAAGEHLDADVISRLRGVLANGASRAI